ncbi:MAG: serine protease [Trueperaceae bacterium]|nr:MAG: serine protease [Trueperaceae bacterium]
MAIESLTKPEALLAAEATRAAPPSRRHEGRLGPGADVRSRSAEVFTVSGRGESIGFAMETVIGTDERKRVPDTDLHPWRKICALRIRGPGGTGAIGTGWFIGPRTVVTAGHCVFSQTFFGGWADAVEVIPGQNRQQNGTLIRPFGSAVGRRMSVLDEWAKSDDREPDFDIGCIHLDEPLGDKTGWFGFASLPPNELAGFMVNISGYPSDRGGGDEQYFASNRILHVGERRVFYDVDTHGGQSGAPVWIQEADDAPPLVVAVHAYGIGATPTSLGIVANSAPRIIPEIYDILEGWLEHDTQPATAVG